MKQVNISKKNEYEKVKPFDSDKISQILNKKGENRTKEEQDYYNEYIAYLEASAKYNNYNENKVNAFRKLFQYEIVPMKKERLPKDNSKESQWRAESYEKKYEKIVKVMRAKLLPKEKMIPDAREICINYMIKSYEHLRNELIKLNVITVIDNKRY